VLGQAIRGEFPIFEHTTYANSCSQGALSNRVRAAAEEWLAGWDENGAEWEFWVERNEAARSAFAGLLHAEPDEVAVTTSVSQGVSALVSALDLSGERNRIVISEYEFPTVGQIAHAQELRGAEVVHVQPGADGRIPLERWAEAVDERTALACCTAVSFRSGHRNDVTAIAEIAHAEGALVLADSYQAIGAIEMDVGTLGADVVTGGTVKYLLGSAGLGFMWLRGSVLASPDPDRVVRRRGHLRHVHRRLLAARVRKALRQRDAARPVALPGRCGDGADRRGRGARDRGARRHARRPPLRRPGRAGCDCRDSPLEG
jgi:selenocysteine lyase/cysteine desulfurase